MCSNLARNEMSDLSAGVGVKTKQVKYGIIEEMSKVQLNHSGS